jgi:hypothetical protein
MLSVAPLCPSWFGGLLGCKKMKLQLLREYHEDWQMQNHGT